MRTLRRRGGFTLSELLVGLVVTSIIMTATTAIFIGVQTAYQAETETKVITENGRGALMYLERVLPLAGYGLDPRIAFDVSGTVARDNQDVRTVGYTPGQPAINGPADTVVTDDLAFRYRDPTFLRPGRLSSATLVTLDQPLNLSLAVGKLLAVGCRGGAEFAYVRLTAAAVPADTTLAVAAAAAPLTSSTNSCLQATGTGSPWVFLVQEYRLRVVNLAGRPWLVAFRNLESNVTNLNAPFDPIAPDVEVFQFAFGMNRARPLPALPCCQTPPDLAGNSNFLVGDAAGETFFAQPANVLTVNPSYATSYDDPSRFTALPANIRSVHVGLVLRAARRGANDGRLIARTTNLMNWTSANPGNDTYVRSLFHSAINTPNLLSRSGFVPALRSAADLRDLNSWGG